MTIRLAARPGGWVAYSLPLRGSFGPEGGLIIQKEGVPRE
jgi:hypothetical protein